MKPTPVYSIKDPGDAVRTDKNLLPWASALAGGAERGNAEDRERTGIPNTEMTEKTVSAGFLKNVLLAAVVQV